MSGRNAGRAPRTNAEWARDVAKRLDRLENPQRVRVGSWLLSSRGGRLTASRDGRSEVFLDRAHEETRIEQTTLATRGGDGGVPPEDITEAITGESGPLSDINDWLNDRFAGLLGEDSEISIDQIIGEIPADQLGDVPLGFLTEEQTGLLVDPGFDGTINSPTDQWTIVEDVYRSSGSAAHVEADGVSHSIRSNSVRVREEQTFNGEVYVAAAGLEVSDPEATLLTLSVLPFHEGDPLPPQRIASATLADAVGDVSDWSAPPSGDSPRGWLLRGAWKVPVEVKGKRPDQAALRLTLTSAGDAGGFWWDDARATKSLRIPQPWVDELPEDMRDERYNRRAITRTLDGTGIPDDERPTGGEDDVSELGGVWGGLTGGVLALPGGPQDLKTSDTGPIWSGVVDRHKPHMVGDTRLTDGVDYDNLTQVLGSGASANAKNKQVEKAWAKLTEMIATDPTQLRSIDSKETWARIITTYRDDITGSDKLTSGADYDNLIQVLGDGEAPRDANEKVSQAWSNLMDLIAANPEKLRNNSGSGDMWSDIVDAYQDNMTGDTRLARGRDYKSLVDVLAHGDPGNSSNEKVAQTWSKLMSLFSSDPEQLREIESGQTWKQIISAYKDDITGDDALTDGADYANLIRVLGAGEAPSQANEEVSEAWTNLMDLIQSDPSKLKSVDSGQAWSDIIDAYKDNIAGDTRLARGEDQKSLTDVLGGGTGANDRTQTVADVWAGLMDTMGQSGPGGFVGGSSGQRWQNIVGKYVNDMSGPGRLNTEVAHSGLMSAVAAGARGKSVQDIIDDEDVKVSVGDLRSSLADLRDDLEDEGVYGEMLRDTGSAVETDGWGSDWSLSGDTSAAWRNDGLAWKGSGTSSREFVGRYRTKLNTDDQIVRMTLRTIQGKGSGTPHNRVIARCSSSKSNYVFAEVYGDRVKLGYVKSSSEHTLKSVSLPGRLAPGTQLQLVCKGNNFEVWLGSRAKLIDYTSSSPRKGSTYRYPGAGMGSGRDSDGEVEPATISWQARDVAPIKVQGSGVLLRASGDGSITGTGGFGLDLKDVFGTQDYMTEEYSYTKIKVGSGKVNGLRFEKAGMYLVTSMFDVRYIVEVPDDPQTQFPFLRVNPFLEKDGNSYLHGSMVTLQPTFQGNPGNPQDRAILSGVFPFYADKGDTVTVGINAQQLSPAPGTPHLTITAEQNGSRTWFSVTRVSK